jgi:hypothetical protein
MCNLNQEVLTFEVGLKMNALKIQRYNYITEYTFFLKLLIFQLSLRRDSQKAERRKMKNLRNLHVNNVNAVMSCATYIVNVMPKMTLF